MADLLGSILGSMEKPPSVDDKEKKRIREHKKQMEKIQQNAKEKLNQFRAKIQAQINDFIRDTTKEKLKFESMDKVYRAIVHEIAEVAGLTSFSFGQEDVDRHIIVWKKEFAPSDDELATYRKGEEWNPEKAKEIAKQRELKKLEDEQERLSQPVKIVPHTNYQEKYEHLIGRDAAKDAAHLTTANKTYGFVSSENKRDKRTIEEVLAQTQAKKKLKSEQNGQSSKSEDSKSSS